ncbi:carbamoyltransferase HypF [Thalassomonas actiniarum]|uniref:Carbamoyltransferase HypF n=1 Tax=Thalassomonas actiniarum TaxID=485447 RepID=A0AAE9YYF9_9GAMM|nr:carbamoyltransferase HypF [Thalassomonas actiniarum]
MENQEVRVRGTVQGVGFRPTVYRLALECDLKGEVSNDSDGVLVRLSGVSSNIEIFVQRLQAEAPPLAKIDAVETLVIDALWQYKDFSIRQSNHCDGSTEVSADAASCHACLREVFDPDERRYCYPFTNCTHCGPRLTIIQGIPYDRSNTTMRDFSLCSECLAEYSQPLDRRFHAQPVACHQCGPQLLMHYVQSGAGRESASNTLSAKEEQSFQKLTQINQALSAGKIIAIKGLGGFHLCCDASNHQAVTLLRERKHRYAKPFALMSHDVDNIRQFCAVSSLEKSTLESSAAPIVLLQKKQQLEAGVPVLSEAIAPGSHLLGFMLPYTPLHHLISRKFAKPLIMTSGNLSGEPQIIENSEALNKLSAIADIIVYHDRDIANRIDDSVVRLIDGKARMMRRARGYAPRSIALPEGFEKAENILAYGAELKSTFCMIKQGVAILSQHQGDLENLETFEDYEKNLGLYQRLFEFTPRYLAYDKHPEYLSTKLALQDGKEQALTAIPVQHHHAHMASAMAENNIPLASSAVLGIALDGLGFGSDGTLWGGEFLLGDYCDFKRLARLKPVVMPGAAQAIKQPWRNTYAHILNSMSWDAFCRAYGATDLAGFLKSMPIATLDVMLAEKLNCPLASSAGRLFDAVAGALGLSAAQVQFEGQAAIELEMLADARAILAGTVTKPYPLIIDEFSSEKAQPLLELNPASLWPPLLNDLHQGESVSVIATRFHAGLIAGIVCVVDRLKQVYKFNQVALSGGCLQNAILFQGVEKALQERNITCLTHARVPANDGGIALGQGAIAAARLIRQPATNKQDLYNNFL